MTMGVVRSGKGYTAEEALRNYFIKLGYFAVRGVSFKHADVDITDIDILLFGKHSPLSRERINVDAKNKKSSKVSERIFFAAGICSLLKYNSFIVATADSRSEMLKFSSHYDVTLLNGTFLQKITTSNSFLLDRISEEELCSYFEQGKIGKIVSNYVAKFNIAKSRLIHDLTFSTCNELLSDCHYFAMAVIDDAKIRNGCLRALYAIVSYFLLTLDFLQKDFTFMSEDERSAVMYEGFTYGNVGQQGMSNYANTIFSFLESDEKILPSAIAAAKVSFREAFVSLPTKMLSDYFSRNQVGKDLFKAAKDFDDLAYGKTLSIPENLPPSIKSTLFLLLDYFEIDRTLFVNSFCDKNI